MKDLLTDAAREILVIVAVVLMLVLSLGFLIGRLSA